MSDLWIECFSFLVCLCVCQSVKCLSPDCEGFISYHFLVYLPSGQSAPFIYSSFYRLYYIIIFVFPFGPLVDVDVLGTYCVCHLFVNFHLGSLHFYLSWGQTTPFISTFLHRLYSLTVDQVGPAVRLIIPMCDPIVTLVYR